jgi:hypothetical protein
MTILHNITSEQLRKLIAIKEEIESLTAQLDAIVGNGGPAASASDFVKKEESAVASAPVPRRGVYKRSKAARAAMAAAQKARWAKIKGGDPEAANGETAPKKQRKMSAAGRARISAAAKARWAMAKAQGKSGL